MSTRSRAIISFGGVHEAGTILNRLGFFSRSLLSTYGPPIVPNRYFVLYWVAQN